MASSIHASKAALRERVKKNLAANLLGDGHVRQSEKAVRALLSMPEYIAARRLSVYLSMPLGEVQTDEVVRDALSRGKKLFVPYIYKTPNDESAHTQSAMAMLQLRSIDDLASLKRDKWGIPSLDSASCAERDNALGGKGPKEMEDEAVNASKGLDLIVMPGMAFDRGFRRLGHGKGYYDRYLRRYYDRRTELNHITEPFLVGLALEEQLLAKDKIVPTNDSDWPVNALVVGDGEIFRNIK